jgi:hypothetical protein
MKRHRKNILFCTPGGFCPVFLRFRCNFCKLKATANRAKSILTLSGSGLLKWLKRL